LNGANRSFFFPDTKINYAVKVSDKEDGSLVNGKLPPSQVAVTIDYLSEGFDLTEIATRQRSVEASIQNVRGLNLINKSDCKACHQINKKTLGPSFMQVALKYKNSAAMQEKMAKKIISGGSGVWGDAAMPAHPSIPLNDAKMIAQYIFSLSEKKKIKSLPVKGTYKTKVPSSENDKGSFVFRAAYTDKGTKSAPAQYAEDLVILRNPIIGVAEADKSGGVEFAPGRTTATAKGSGSYIGLIKIDLTGIDSVELAAYAFGGMGPGLGGIIQIRLDLPTGTLIGQTDTIAPPASGSGRGGRRGQRTKAAIGDVTGIRDVYFVFVNEKAKTLMYCYQLPI
jgi:cytochrome c